MKIDWEAPADRGSPIQNYTITLRNSGGSFVELGDCDGTASATITNTECSVQQSTLRDTFGLSYGAKVIAKVKATNLVGSGDESTSTT